MQRPELARTGGNVQAHSLAATYISDGGVAALAPGVAGRTASLVARDGPGGMESQGELRETRDCTIHAPPGCLLI